MTQVAEFEGSPGLRALQEAVGGYIQLVPDFPTYRGRPCDVWVDEEGLLKGKPVNLRMTREWREVLDRSGRPYDKGMAVLVGDAAVVYKE